METQQRARYWPLIEQLLAAIRIRIPHPVRFGLYLVLATIPCCPCRERCSGSSRCASSASGSSCRCWESSLFWRCAGRMRSTGQFLQASPGAWWRVPAHRLPAAGSLCLPPVGRLLRQNRRMGNGHEVELSRWLPVALPRRRCGHRSSGFSSKAAVIGVSSWPRRYVVGLTVAFAVFPVWTGLVLTHLPRSGWAGIVPARRDDARVEPDRPLDLRSDPGLRAVGITRS